MYSTVLDAGEWIFQRWNRNVETGTLRSTSSSRCYSDTLPFELRFHSRVMVMVTSRAVALPTLPLGPFWGSLVGLPTVTYSLDLTFTNVDG